MSLETVNFDFLGLQANQTVLDLGCGEGRHAITAYMLENVFSVGIDLSLQDLQTTQERFSQFQEKDNPDKTLLLSVASGNFLPFPDQSFDTIICSEVLEHIENYEEVLSEITRVLKENGKLAVSVPRFWPEWICWKLSTAYHQVPGGHIRIFDARNLQKTIERFGFSFCRRHWAHALHVPYWWLKCLFWSATAEQNSKETWVVAIYHRFLVWDLMKKPLITGLLDKLLNPLMGKSVVIYFVKKTSASQSQRLH